MESADDETVFDCDGLFEAVDEVVNLPQYEVDDVEEKVEDDMVSLLANQIATCVDIVTPSRGSDPDHPSRSLVPARLDPYSDP